MSRLNRRSVGALAATSGIVAGLMASGPLAGATPTFKFAYATAAPSPIYVGATTKVTVTLFNANFAKPSSTSNQPFGSAELTFGSLPAGSVAVDTLPAGWSAKLVGTSPPVVLLTSTNSASIQPGSSADFGFDVTPTTAASITVHYVVKQSNDFAGTGNIFNSTAPDPVITVVPITIAFEQEPSDVSTAPGPDHFMCSPVAVSTMAGSTPVSGVSVTITNGATGDPGLTYNTTKVGAAGKTVVSVDGVATFSDTGDCTSGFTGTNLGTGYTLTASSPAASGPITSTPFDVVQSIKDCLAGVVCDSGNLNSPANGTTGDINTTFGTPGKLLGSFGQGALTCDNQVTTSAITADPFDSQSLGTAASGIVTLTFPKAVVNNLANNGTPLMQVCAGASASFPGSTDLGSGMSPEWQGLVANCTTGYQNVVDNICVLSRSKHAADETITLFVYDLSDPHYW